MMPSHPAVVIKPMSASLTLKSSAAGAKFVKLRNIQQFHALCNANVRRTATPLSVNLGGMAFSIVTEKRKRSHYF
jgi:hypothetical protein